MEAYRSCADVERRDVLHDTTSILFSGKFENFGANFAHALTLELVIKSNREIPNVRSQRLASTDID